MTKNRIQLVEIIGDIIYLNGWKQKEAAKALNITQGAVSDLVNGKYAKFSVGALLKFLHLLGWKVNFKYKDGIFSARAEAV